VNRREFVIAGIGLAARIAPAEPRAPQALVTADTESHVVVVSMAGRILRRVATIEGPRSIQSGPAGIAVVGHSAAGAVTLLGGRPARVQRVLHGFEEPRYSVFAPDGRHAYVTDSGSGELTVVDVLRGRVVRRIEVGALARHVGISPSGRRLWVALGSSASTVVVVDLADPRRPRVSGRIHPPFLVHDVAVSPRGDHVWMTAGRERRLAVYAASGRGRPLLLGADRAPQHVTFGAGRAYVASGEGRSVTVHSLADGRALRRVRVPIGSYNVQTGGGAVLTPSLNSGTLTMLDRRGRVRAAPRVAAAAHDACVTG
jgi:YVTN family beta-propeller protein